MGLSREHICESDVKRKDAGGVMWGFAGEVFMPRVAGYFAPVCGVLEIDGRGICPYNSMRAVCLNPDRSNCCVYHHGEHVGLDECAVVGECTSGMIKP